MGIPFGLILPSRPRYLIIDALGAIIFFISISVVRIVEGVFTGQILLAGGMYAIFLLGAYISASRWNREATNKEELIKSIQKHVDEQE